jgi:hypothetical protein
LRPIRPDEELELIAQYDGLSRNARLSIDWARFFANFDHQTRLALVVERAGVDRPGSIAVLGRSGGASRL